MNDDLLAYRIEMLRDSTETFRRLSANAILSQVGAEPLVRSNPYEGIDCQRLVERCLVRSGSMKKPGEPRTQYFSRAMTTEDFKNILADVSNKMLLIGWEESQTSYQLWTGSTTVKDFKAASLASLSPFSNLSKITEGEEITYGEALDTKESVTLQTFAKIFNVTRTALINDELEVITNTPKLIGAAARRTVDAEVYALLVANPALADGHNLISAEHSNSITGAPTVASIDTAKATLGKQTWNGVVFDSPLTHLICPKALDGTMRTIAGAQAETGDSIQVVSSAHLDLASGVKWYGVSKQLPSIVVATLRGKSEPTVTVKPGFVNDTQEFKVVFDFAVAAVSPFGIVGSSGV